MRTKRVQRVNLAEDKIQIVIPLSYETIDVNGKLGWTIGAADIQTPLNDDKTREVILDSLRKAGII